MPSAPKELEEKILDTFAEVAQGIGYSPLHGKIIGVLLVEDRPVSLQDLAKLTGYSASTISLSLDFLELLGVIKKVKVSADRKLYVQLQGDLLEALKKVFITRLKKNISSSLEEFEKNRSELKSLSGENGKAAKSLEKLENEIRRLENYVDLLSEMKLP